MTVKQKLNSKRMRKRLEKAKRLCQVSKDVTQPDWRWLTDFRYI